MFEEYQNAVTKAVSDSSKSKNDFTNKRESLTIEIKNTLANECDSIEDTTLADYNPLKIHNEITKLKHQFNQLFVDEEEAQKKIKETLDTTLQNIMKIKLNIKTHYVYVIAGGHYDTLCIVWFTLTGFVPKHYKGNYHPGDPIAISFVPQEESQYGISRTSLPDFSPATNQKSDTAFRCGDIQDYDTVKNSPYLPKFKL